MTDYAALQDKLTDLGYLTGNPIRKAVIELHYTFDAQSIPIGDRPGVASLFSWLIDNPANRDNNPAVWEDFHLGETRPGDTVRIKNNAYDTESGQKHNGLVGTLVAVRGGRCIVQYLGRNDGVGHYHPPHLIEVLKK